MIRSSDPFLKITYCDEEKIVCSKDRKYEPIY